MSLPHSVKRYTVAEYYEREHAEQEKSEFYDGEIFAMAGGTASHSRICSNLVREIGNRLKGTPCFIYDPNLRLKVKANGLRTYPDASVYCGKLERDHEDSYVETYTNPTVLFEVLSPSTEGYDRGFKATSYRQIETLKSYVLVSQTSVHVEAYDRQEDGTWRLREVSDLRGTLALPSIGVDLPLAEIYDGVEFRAADGTAIAESNPRPGSTH